MESDTISTITILAILIFAFWLVLRIFSHRSSRRYTKKKQDNRHLSTHIDSPSMSQKESEHDTMILASEHASEKKRFLVPKPPLTGPSSQHNKPTSNANRLDARNMYQKESELTKVNLVGEHAPEKKKFLVPKPPLTGYLSRHNKPKTKAKSSVSPGWVPKHISANIAGRAIGGMVYVGRGPRTGHGGNPDNAFIDPSKNVTSRGGDFAGKGMHYWPNYSTIKAQSRATYLDWLSTGRSDKRYNVGYVFLYFYGLERRVFVDIGNEREHADIIAEVHRLLEIYGDNCSIRRYLGAFIDATSIKNYSNEPQPIFEHAGYDVPANVLIELGRMAARNVPLKSDWLLSWYMCTRETKLRTPAKRAFDEFRAYFRYLFDQEYPKGLKIRVPKRQLKLMYHASSGNFVSNMIENLDGIPDITSLSRPLKVAQRIADTAMVALDKYSRYLGRNPDGRGTIEAHALLPEVLWTLFPCPEKEELNVWVTKQIESGGLVLVEDIFERLEGTQSDRISKHQLIGVADALAKLGVGLAPDPRFALRMPLLGEPVVLFHLPVDTLSIENPSEAYRSAILSIVIGTLIAHSDGQFDYRERAQLASHIDANHSVTEAERARLHANLTWMNAVPPDMKWLRNKLRSATDDVRDVLGQLALVAAGADGVISPDEIHIIKRLYSVMGLDHERIYADLHALMSVRKPVTVNSVGNVTQVRDHLTATLKKPTSMVTLDPELISAVMADTARVSQVLGEIFTYDDDEDEDGVDDYITEVDDEFSGLDLLHRAVTSVVITRRHWTEDEFADLAKEHQLMAAGALETINEWAYNRFGDALIEVYDEYETNIDVAQQLMI